MRREGSKIGERGSGLDFWLTLGGQNPPNILVVYLCHNGKTEQARESFDKSDLILRIFSSLILGGHITITYFVLTQ